MVTTSHIIRGGAFLDQHPNFKLIGREEELNTLCSILMRRKSNSVLLVGAGGVGATALCMGLQAMKTNPNAPFDIIAKRFYWYDTNALFSSGDAQAINAQFQKDIAKLWRRPDDVLILRDTRSFFEAAERTGCGHFINLISQTVRRGDAQIILEVRDDDLDYVMKVYQGVREDFTLMDLQEPGKAALEQIVEGSCAALESYHGVRISTDARKAAIELTTKYRPDALNEAQPARAVSLLDRALSSYRLDAHHTPPHLVRLQAAVNKAPADQREALEADLSAQTATWLAQQDQFKKLWRDMREGEVAIQTLEDEIDEIQIKEAERRERMKAAGQEAILDEAAPQPVRFSAANFTQGNLGDSPEVSERRNKIKKLDALVGGLRDQFNTMAAEINRDLELSRADILAEFASISGIDASKLDEDEAEVLRNLEVMLKNRVFGQDHILLDVSNGVKVAKIDHMVGIDSEKPLASYLFMGPSGVGKTEVARVLSEALGMPLLRFDMSEYMEKHAVARLIGAPPGYEGFAAGGALTNALRKNRRVVILFDEMEKAHKDVFDVMLQVIDAGRLTDNVGRVADFSEAIVIFTTNVGQPYFLDKDMPFAEAQVWANKDLEATYRPEFLNRFNGRENILCFNRLELDSIERIVRREITKIDAAYSKRHLNITMEETSLKVFCEVKYDPKKGARGLPGIIQARLKPVIVNTILNAPSAKGVFTVDFDKETQEFAVEFLERSITLSAA